jgi:hypothetical protein
MPNFKRRIKILGVITFVMEGNGVEKSFYPFNVVDNIFKGPLPALVFFSFSTPSIFCQLGILRVSTAAGVMRTR